MAVGIVGFLSGSIDSALATFVVTTSSAVAAGVAPLVVTGMSIWILTFGYAVMRNEVHDALLVYVKSVIKMSIIFTIALSGGIYQSQIVDGVQAFQNGFVSIVAPNATGDIYGVLDNYDSKVTELGLVIIGHGMTLLPWGGWLDLLAGLVVLVSSAVMILMCGGFLLMAKVALAFMLGIGPAFIASLAFPPIAKFFEAWMGKVMNYCFLIVGLAMAVTIAVTICQAYVDHFTASQGATNEIADAFGLVIVQGALLILIYQMPHIASGLGGGASLSGGGAGAFIAGMMMGGSKPPAPSRNDGGGGSITDNSGSRGGGSSQNQQGGSSKEVPAYRRATLDRLE
jgi:type IV secretion system protein VirB6